MHEGFEHIKLGLKGIPSLAEELGILRDIHLAEYNEAHVHIANVSTAKGVELIKNAKAKGIKVTAQCSIHHLFFNDEDMHGFDSNLKLLPPLRSKKDQDALIEGLKTGIIDTVTSDHIPQDIEAKKMEFDLAEFGTAGIETCFNALLTIAGKKLGLEKIVELLAINSRKSFGLNSPSIAENQEFEAALYNPDGSYTHGNATKVTKAYNDPYVGKTLQGEIFQIN
jgi:dihydroorotase